jgi:competence protein ComEC
MSLGQKSFLFFIFFIFGVFLSNLGIKLILILIGTLIVFLLFVCVYLIKPDSRLLSVGFLFLAVFVGAFWAKTYLYIKFKNNQIVYNRNVEISGQIVSVPKNYEKFKTFNLETEKGEVFLVKVSYYEQLNYQDQISVFGIIKPVSFQNAYLKKDGVLGVIDFPKINFKKEAEGFLIKKFLYSLRESMAQVYKMTLENDKSALITGILLGQQSADFSPAFRQSMKNSGTTHITALSGYNITILISALFLILSFVFSRKITFVFCLIAIALFVIMTGAQSSVVRAAIMGSLVILAQRFSRVYSFKQAMAFSAFLMILTNPLILKFDVGFILSFLSLAGITYLAPILSTYLKTSKVWLDKVKSLFFETFSAQIAVLPVLSAYFGGFSLSGLISNVLILPLIPTTMAIGFFVGLVGIIWMPLAKVFLWPLSFILEVEVKIIKFFGSIPQIQLRLGFWAIIFYYLIIILFLIKNKSRLNFYEYSI